jgi:hypothetical protein
VTENGQYPNRIPDTTSTSETFFSSWIWSFRSGDYSLCLLPASCWFPVRLTLLPCRWRQYVHPKFPFTFTGLHGVISLKTELFFFPSLYNNLAYSWRRRQYVPPKHRLTFTGLYGVASLLKTELFTSLTSLYGQSLRLHMGSLRILSFPRYLLPRPSGLCCTACFGIFIIFLASPKLVRTALWRNKLRASPFSPQGCPARDYFEISPHPPSA